MLPLHESGQTWPFQDASRHAVRLREDCVCPQRASCWTSRVLPSKAGYVPVRAFEKVEELAVDGALEAALCVGLALSPAASDVGLGRRGPVASVSCCRRHLASGADALLLVISASSMMVRHGAASAAVGEGALAPSPTATMPARATYGRCVGQSLVLTAPRVVCGLGQGLQLFVRISVFALCVGQLEVVQCRRWLLVGLEVQVLRELDHVPAVGDRDAAQVLLR